MRTLIWGAALLLFTAVAGCKHQTETYSSEALSAYLPLAVGKFITYSLDSTVFTNLGRIEETHHYQEKQEIAAQMMDNLGRLSYQVNRFIRDSAGTEGWRTAGSFYITPLEKTIEVVENNLRTVRLALPIKKYFSWKGNEYLPFEPYGDLYEYSISTNSNPVDWDFFYESVDESLSLNGQTIDNVITVKHIDEETTTNGDVSPTNKTYSEDKYAKGTGLVYQELVMWEREPNVGGSSPFKLGFGVKRTLLEHN